MIWESSNTKRFAEALSASCSCTVPREDAVEISELLRSQVASWSQQKAERWADSILPQPLSTKDSGRDVDPTYYWAVTPLSNSFTDDIESSYPDLFTGPAPLRALAHWHSKSLLAISKYTLHVAWADSGLPYREWIGRFLQAPVNNWSSIFSHYPMLLRFLHNTDSNIRAATIEMLCRVEQDRSMLTEGLGSKGCITDVELGLSDPHRGGRSVARIAFENGVSVMYKPKPLRIDRLIQEFASQSTSFGHPGLFPLKTLSCDGYGWMEIAGSNNREMVSPKAIGKAAALFWLLNATDLHSENLVGHGQDLAALDLETLLTAPMSEPKGLPDPSWRTHTLLSTQLAQISYGTSRRPNISGLFPESNVELLSNSLEFFVERDSVQVRRIAADRRSDEQGLRSTNQRYSSHDIVSSFEQAIQSGLPEVQNLSLIHI